jgi:hypothetical protein
MISSLPMRSWRPRASRILRAIENSTVAAVCVCVNSFRTNVAAKSEAICGSAVATLWMLSVEVVRSVVCETCACELKEKAKRNRIVSRVNCSLMLGQGCETEKVRWLSPTVLGKTSSEPLGWRIWRPRADAAKNGVIYRAFRPWEHCFKRSPTRQSV